MPTDETSPSDELHHGHTAVGGTAVQLTNLAFQLDRGLLVKADAANSAPVWIGRKAVTADSHSDTGGMPVEPGEALVLPVDDPSKVFAISTAADQDLAWMGI